MAVWERKWEQIRQVPSWFLSFQLAAVFLISPLLSDRDASRQEAGFAVLTNETRHGNISPWVNAQIPFQGFIRLAQDHIERLQAAVVEVAIPLFGIDGHHAESVVEKHRVPGRVL